MCFQSTLLTCGHTDVVDTWATLEPGSVSCSVLEPLQTVQRAELWAVVLALQARTSVHIGGGNLNVVRHVGRLLGALDEHGAFSLLLYQGHVDEKRVCTPFAS